MGVKIQRPGDPGHPGGNRRIYVRVNYTPPGTKPKRDRQPGEPEPKTRLTRVFNTTKGAEAYASQVEAYLKLGNVAAVFTDPTPAAEPRAVPTVAEIAEGWFGVAKAAWKANTEESYRGMFAQHILPAIGGRRVDDITEADVEAWWAALCGKGFSARHLSHIRHILTGILRRAVRMDHAAKNPADAIAGKIRREDREVHEVAWLTEPELTRFLAEAKAQEARHYPALLTLATTGIRQGEVLGLQVGDVDLARGKLSVRRAVRRYRVSSPKNGKPRTVDVPPSTMAILRQWLEVVRAEAAVRGQEPLWLFPSDSGHILEDRQLRLAMRRALKAAGVARAFKLHGLRHTYASLAIQRGVPLLVVSRHLGHGSVAITADVYGHLAPDATRQAADAWEAILTAPGRNPGATPDALPS